MVPDLLFHVVSKRKWKLQIRDGMYRPEHYHEDNGVETVTGKDINKYLNAMYAGRKNLLLIVIETSRLRKRSAITQEVVREQKGKREQDVQQEQNVVHQQTGNGAYEIPIYRIPEPIHKLAILDKIRIDCNEKGLFDVQLHQDGDED